MLGGKLSYGGEAACSESICKLIGKCGNFCFVYHGAGWLHAWPDPWPWQGQAPGFASPCADLILQGNTVNKSSWCTSAGTLVLDIHGFRTAGHNQLHPVWCLNQKHSPTGIFLEHFIISRLTISFTVTCGIKTVR